MGGFIVNGALLVDSKEIRKGALRVEGERIAEVFSDELDENQLQELLSRYPVEVVDGRGLWLLPGGVDPHVHFELPVSGTRTVDDFVTGSRAALAGGTTSFIDFVTPIRGQRLLEAIHDRLEAAKSSACDFKLHASLTQWRPDSEDDLAICVREMGVGSLKLYTAYLDTLGLSGDDLVSALCAAERLGVRILVHCEDGRMIEALQQEQDSSDLSSALAFSRSRPPETEVKSVRDILSLTRQLGCRTYLVHISTSGALEAVVEARKKGQDVYAETCPQYLLLDDAVYDRKLEDALPFVMCPPLRSLEHVKTLRDAVVDGHIDVIASDHCAFSSEQKRAFAGDFKKMLGGAAGVQHRLALTYSLFVKRGMMKPNEWVRIVSTTPARIFGLYPRKGSLDVGADADLVLWDPNDGYTILASKDYHRADNSVYEGNDVYGRPRRVWSRGELAVSDGVVSVSSGRGRFIKSGDN